MPNYCTVDDVQNVLAEEIGIGTNLLEENVNVLEGDVNNWIEYSADIIDSYINTIYRTPLIQYKEPDFTEDPPTFQSKYPSPIPLINAELAASFVYDNVIMAQQSPNQSEWGTNKRSLAYDRLRDIMSGLIVLKGQVQVGNRFVRRSLFDDPRVSRPVEFPPTQRQSGK